MRPYLLLTPGPLTTSESVKTAMMTDWCTWDEDYNVHIVEEIRKGLVQLATRKTDEYTSILMQGKRYLLRRGDLGKCDYAQTQIIDSEQRCIRRTHGKHCRISWNEL